jgi:hypothetical protein
MRTAATVLQPLSRFSAGIAIGAVIVACCFKVAAADAAPLSPERPAAARMAALSPTTDSTCAIAPAAARCASRSAPGCHRH